MMTLRGSSNLKTNNWFLYCTDLQATPHPCRFERGGYLGWGFWSTRSDLEGLDVVHLCFLFLSLAGFASELEYGHFKL